MTFFEVSAKSGVNVTQAFKAMTTQLQGLIDPNQSIINNNETKSSFAVSANTANQPNNNTPKGNCQC